MRRKFKPKPIKPLPEQQAFINWLKRERHRLAMPVRLTTEKGSPIVRFEGVPDKLYSIMNSYDLDVWAWDPSNQWCDWIWSRDFSGKQRGNGYICLHCESYAKVSAVWPTMDAYLADHVFEPWLQWVNEQLALSSHMTFVRDDGGGGDATLMRVCGPLLPPGRWRLRLCCEASDDPGWVATRVAAFMADEGAELAQAQSPMAIASVSSPQQI